MRRGIDPAAEAVRRAKKLMFNPRLWNEERSVAAERPANGSPAADYKDFLTARKVKTQSGEFGYLRIWSFDVDDDQRFIEAAIELLAGLPDRGLIIDLRDNPGGFIWAAERMLQLFTPNQITPTKFALRATPLTAQMATARFNQGELGPWADSLASAPSTGEPYSTHLPITTVEQCNDLGQYYGGPVVAVVNAEHLFFGRPVHRRLPGQSHWASWFALARRQVQAARTCGAQTELGAAMKAAWASHGRARSWRKSYCRGAPCCAQRRC